MQAGVVWNWIIAGVKAHTTGALLMIPQSCFVSTVYTQACGQVLQCSSWQASERPGDVKDISADHSANDKATEKVCVRELGASSEVLLVYQTQYG